MIKLTPDELLDRLERRREIRNTMGRISHDCCVMQDAQIYRRYWSRRDDVCLGLNDGFYQGAAAVAGYYEALGRKIELTSRLIYEKFPDAFQGKSLEDCCGVGMINYLPLDSHVIEIAGDGQTAKALFNVRGSYCYLTGAGPVSNWTYGWLAADMVMEEDEFKIWHMQLLYNVDHPCGVGFCDEPRTYEPVSGFEAAGEFRMPEPNVKIPLLEHYHPMRPYAGPPRVPEPYAAFGETFSYGA